MRGEFLTVTFSWEIAGPAPKFSQSVVVVRESEADGSGLRAKRRFLKKFLSLKKRQKMVHKFYTRHGKLSFTCVMRSKVGFFQVIYTLKVN